AFANCTQELPTTSERRWGGQKSPSLFSGLRAVSVSENWGASREDILTLPPAARGSAMLLCVQSRHVEIAPTSNLSHTTRKPWCRNTHPTLEPCSPRSSACSP